MRRRLTTAFTVALAAALCAGTITAQRRGRGFGATSRTPTPQSFDGAFNFCRIAFPYSNMGDGGGWLVDYPRADINLSIRLSELTKTRISLEREASPTIWSSGSRIRSSINVRSS